MISNREKISLDFPDQEMVLKMPVLLNKCVPFQQNAEQMRSFPTSFHPGFAQEQSKAHGTAPAAAHRLVTSVWQNASSARFEL